MNGFGAPNGEIIKSEIMETIFIHFKHKIKRKFVGFGRIPSFGSLVIIEKHISTRGCATRENMILYDHS